MSSCKRCVIIHSTQQIRTMQGGRKRMKKITIEKNQKRLRQIGIKIGAIRKLRGMSQIALAEKAEISRSLLSSIEAPKLACNFTIEVLFNIADALNVEVKDLLDDDNWDFMNQNV